MAYDKYETRRSFKSGMLASTYAANQQAKTRLESLLSTQEYLKKNLGDDPSFEMFPDLKLIPKLKSDISRREEAIAFYRESLGVSNPTG